MTFDKLVWGMIAPLQTVVDDVPLMNGRLHQMKSNLQINYEGTLVFSLAEISFQKMKEMQFKPQSEDGVFIRELKRVGIAIDRPQSKAYSCVADDADDTPPRPYTLTLKEFANG